MLRPEFSGQFKRDYKLALKRGCDPKKLEEVFQFCVVRNLCRNRIGITLLQIQEITRA